MVIGVPPAGSSAGAAVSPPNTESVPAAMAAAASSAAALASGRNVEVGVIVHHQAAVLSVRGKDAAQPTILHVLDNRVQDACPVIYLIGDDDVEGQ